MRKRRAQSSLELGTLKVEGKWVENGQVVNNVRRRWLAICRGAGIAGATLHDLRRGCITNWAGRLPMHVVQELVGHSDITTTRKYYLAITAEDMDAARRVTTEVLSSLGGRK